MTVLQKHVWFALIAIAALAISAGGCSSDTKPDSKKSDPAAQPSDHGHPHDAGHAHKELTDKDLPKSFNEGLARLQKLHVDIEHLIEHNELKDVHAVAEEMAFIAKHMKMLAQSELPPEKQTEVGRLCNEIAAYFNPIDEAGDSGNKVVTKEISDKMDVAIKKLEASTK